MTLFFTNGIKQPEQGTHKISSFFSKNGQKNLNYSQMPNRHFYTQLSKKKIIENSQNKNPFFRVAEMIRYYVKSQNIFISNYLERNFEERDVIICGTNWYDKETGRHLMSQQLYSNITNERYLLGEETDKDFNVLLTKETPKTEKMSAINNISAASKARQLGTCVFLSVMGYEYFLTLGRKDPSVELFQIEGGDHAFLVVGRNVQSKEDDYQNWGKDTLVCDLWADKIFLASEIEEKLDNYVGCDTNTLQTTLQRFNPAVQRLKRMSLQ